MSKIEKQIQTARAWRKKHAAEALDFTKLDVTLTEWEKSQKLVEAAKEKVHLAKEAVVLAQKAVTAALKEAKGARQPKTPIQPEPPVKKAKKTPKSAS